MAETLRITPQESLEDFVSQGLKPARRAYFSRTNCACGLGARAIQLGFNASMDVNHVNDELIKHFGKAYHDGFARGFDDDSYVSDEATERFIQGHADGLAAWEAVKHLAQ